MDAIPELRLRLIDHLIATGADPKTQAKVFADIHSGSIRATVEVLPALPANPSSFAIANYAKSEPRRVPAMSIPSVKAAILDGALGREADLSALVDVVLHIADDSRQDEPGTGESVIVKRVSAAAAHQENILTALAKLGYDPQALPRAKSGVAGVPKKVRDFLGNKITRSQFAGAWEALSADGRIAYK